MRQTALTAELSTAALNPLCRLTMILSNEVSSSLRVGGHPKNNTAEKIYITVI